MKWVNVKNKLPNNDSRVLVVFDDGFIATVTYMDDWELWDDSGEPKYWMPLPNPPKVDRKARKQNEYL